MRKSKSKSTATLIVGILTALLFNTFIGVGIAFALDVNPTIPVLAMNGISLIPSAIKLYAPGINLNLYSGQLAFAGLNQEMWLAELMQKFRPDGSWLSKARDLSAYVQNEAINLADAGVDPGVIFDYDGADAIPIADTEDTAIRHELKRISTERDKIQVSLLATRPYDIMADRAQRHAKTLEENILKYAAVNFAPASNATNTPVIATSGTTVANRKNCKLDDVLDLEARFLNIDANGEKTLVLHPTHLAHLKKEDKDLFKSLVPMDFVQGFPLFSFTAFVSTATPTYNGSDGVRKAFGAAVEATDSIASFAFLNSEVGRARGGTYAFQQMADPTYQSHFINYMCRFIAVKMRTKGVGAIYSLTA